MNPETIQVLTPNDKTQSLIFRVKRDMPESSGAIEPGANIVPVPELGGFVTKSKLQTRLRVESICLNTPREFNGFKCTMRIDVSYGDAPPQESFFLRADKKDAQRWADDIASLIHRENNAIVNKSQSKPALVYKGDEMPFDARDNSKQAAEKMMRKDYPSFFAAYDQIEAAKGAAREKLKAKAAENYLVDLSRLTGQMPNVADPAKQLSNADLLRRIGFAMSNTKPGRWKATDWELAINWARKGYYRMTKQQLQDAFRESTGDKNIKGDTLYRRAKILGLIPATNPGRPEKPWKNLN